MNYKESTKLQLFTFILFVIVNLTVLGKIDVASFHMNGWFGITIFLVHIAILIFTPYKKLFGKIIEALDDF